MANNFNKFNLFVDDLAKKLINLGTDNINVMLTNTAPVATQHHYSDIAATELAAGNGYSTGGAAVSGVGVSNVSGEEIMTANPTVFTSITGSMGPLRYAVYYDETSGTLIGWYDNGSSITLNGANSDTFTVTPNSGDLLTLQ